MPRSETSSSAVWIPGTTRTNVLRTPTVSRMLTSADGSWRAMSARHSSMRNEQAFGSRNLPPRPLTSWSLISECTLGPRIFDVTAQVARNGPVLCSCKCDEKQW